jgi:hypothetical protein
MNNNLPTDDINSQHDLDVRPFTPHPEVEAKYKRKKPPSNASTGLITLLLLAVIGFIAYKIYQGGFGIQGGVKAYTPDAIANMSFNGVVTDFKYDDNKAHAKVALLSDGTKYSIYKDWVYEINTGDTLIKAKGSTQIQVRRPGKRKEMLDFGPILRKLGLTGRM